MSGRATLPPHHSPRDRVRVAVQSSAPDATRIARLDQSFPSPDQLNRDTLDGKLKSLRPRIAAARRNVGSGQAAAGVDLSLTFENAFPRGSPAGEVAKMDNNMPPQAQGLYDPKNEHDACGIGMIANIKNKPSHEVVQKGLEIIAYCVCCHTLGRSSNVTTKPPRLAI